MKFRSYLFFFIFFVFSSAFTGAGIGFYFFSLPDFSEIRKLETYKPPAITRIYSSDNKPVKELYVERRSSHNTDYFSKYLVDALIATEDRRFYSHSGISPKGMVRAFVKDIIAMSFVEGASTLTQQLAKTLFLSSEKKIKRKIMEILLALQIEKKYTKKEILGLYLNQVYFGSGAYGAESAARTYFSSKASDLTVDQAALIAGMPKAPGYLSPLKNPEKALKRRNIVLKNMYLTKKLSKKDYLEAKEKKLLLKPCKNKNEKYFWYVDYIKQKLGRELGYDFLYKSGLNIYTPLDTQIQTAVEKAIEKNMPVLEKRMKKAGLKSRPEAAAIVMDIKSGNILAMTGGRDFSSSQFNRAIMAERQPGSSFKPFLYALAIEKGYAQNCTLRDAPTIFNLSRNRDWEPENFSKTYSGEMTIRKALVKSKNIPAARLVEKLGPVNLAKFVKKLGIDSRMGNTLSISLGAYETNLLELTRAYAVFANQGKLRQTHFISKIENRGKILYKAEMFEGKKVFPERESAIVVDLLQGVMKEGTGRSGQIKGYPLAGKTGTTNNYHDALFIGFSPSVAVGVWVGCDDGSTLGFSETGAKAALPVWKDIMKAVIDKKKSPEYFFIPDRVVYKKFNSDTGKILRPESNKGVIGMFREENSGGCGEFS
ncbi:MAG: hypothetical protein CSB21_01975 [Deltaproteobacteria bacterium]|nr:MAG: hypothetical protein CSB21_01975 [Deltaproteobacteria bacterium]